MILFLLEKVRGKSSKEVYKNKVVGYTETDIPFVELNVAKGHQEYI